MNSYKIITKETITRTVEHFYQESSKEEAYELHSRGIRVPVKISDEVVHREIVDGEAIYLEPLVQF